MGIICFLCPIKIFAVKLCVMWRITNPRLLNSDLEIRIGMVYFCYVPALCTDCKSVSQLRRIKNPSRRLGNIREGGQFRKPPDTSDADPFRKKTHYVRIAGGQPRLFGIGWLLVSVAAFAAVLLGTVPLQSFLCTMAFAAHTLHIAILLHVIFHNTRSAFSSLYVAKAHKNKAGHTSVRPAFALFCFLCFY